MPAPSLMPTLAPHLRVTVAAYTAVEEWDGSVQTFCGRCPQRRQRDALIRAFAREVAALRRRLGLDEETGQETGL